MDKAAGAPARFGQGMGGAGLGVGGSDQRWTMVTSQWGLEIAVFASIKTICSELFSKQLESQNLFTGSTPYMVLGASAVAVFSTACYFTFLPGALPCLCPV